jgi:hypothetical protein
MRIASFTKVWHKVDYLQSIFCRFKHVVCGMRMCATEIRPLRV